MKLKFLVLLMSLTVSVTAFPVPKIGDVLRYGSDYEISVIFSEPVDPASLSNFENYTLSIGTLVAGRLCATNQGVTLTVADLAPGITGSLRVSGVRDTQDQVIPDAFLEYEGGDRFWALIGENKLGFPADVTALSTNSYDLLSGALQQSQEYDEATFVGENVSGDFEARVKIEFIEPAGAGAKAGIMVREKMDEGKARPLDPDDPAQAFSRYVELAISAPQSALGEGSSTHKIWMRTFSPSITTESLAVTNDAAPAFPNAWLRVERVGQLFTMSRSEDGVTWEALGSAQFPQTLTNEVYVGLAFSAQNNDLPPESGLRGSFVAKFRNYKVIEQATAEIHIERVGDHAEVTWPSGWRLETAPTVTGEWSELVATSPLRVDYTETMRFYRLRR